MQLSIEIPEDIGSVLRERWGDLSASTLELIALKAYRTGLLDAGQVSRLLGFSRHDEFVEFVRREGSAAVGDGMGETAVGAKMSASPGRSLSVRDMLNPIPDLSDLDAQAFASSVLQLREWDRQHGVPSAESI